MKRWRALFCAVLLCGICLSGLCVPVSAADDTQMYLYNGVELPDIETVWLDKEAYPYATICIYDESYYLVLLTVAETCDKDKHIPGVVSSTYGIDNGNWVSVGISPAMYAKMPIWSNYDIFYSDNVPDLGGTLYLVASEPIPIGTESGILIIQSSQVLDDSASFVVSVSDLASTESIYSIKAVLSSAGTEVKSTVTDAFAGTSNEMHLTVANLEPATAYDISFILQKNGTDTMITASTSFTTHAGSGAGEGETPDYTGQLNEIQISVDNVGTKLDGVQETLTETKEEITSLPGKIATSITEGVKGLFIPSQEDLTEIKDKYENMLSKKLGFVWQAFDLLTELIGELHSSLESGKAYEFYFPGVSVPINGEEFVFVPATSVSLENELIDVLRTPLGIIVSMISVIAFLNMAHDYVLAIVSGVSAYQFERRKD